MLCEETLQVGKDPCKCGFRGIGGTARCCGGGGWLLGLAPQIRDPECGRHDRPGHPVLSGS